MANDQYNIFKEKNKQDSNNKRNTKNKKALENEITVTRKPTYFDSISKTMIFTKIFNIFCNPTKKR